MFWSLVYNSKTTVIYTLKTDDEVRFIERTPSALDSCCHTMEMVATTPLILPHRPILAGCAQDIHPFQRQWPKILGQWHETACQLHQSRQ